VVLVSCMTTTAMADDKEAASQRRLWNLASGRSSNSLVTHIPTKALEKWPKMRARGWASGLSIEPKQRTADAP
jgi:hypothetical protein